MLLTGKVFVVFCLNNVERHMKCLKLVMERRHGNVWGCPVTPGQSWPQLVVLLTPFLLK